MTLPEGIYKPEELAFFKKIFDAYYDGIRNFIYFKTGDIDLAEDLVQDVFLKVWDMREKIEESTVKSLLFIMANNLLKNHFKHKKVVFNFVNNTEKEETSEPADYAYEEQEFEKKLQMVLAEIPEKQRTVFLMNRIDNLSYKEIAERLDLSVKAVEKRMHQALLIIKEKIQYKI